MAANTSAVTAVSTSWSIAKLSLATRENANRQVRLLRAIDSRTGFSPRRRGASQSPVKTVKKSPRW